MSKTDSESVCIYFKDTATVDGLRKLRTMTGKSVSFIVDTLVRAALPQMLMQAPNSRRLRIDVEVEVTL